MRRRFEPRIILFVVLVALVLVVLAWAPTASAQPRSPGLGLAEPPLVPGTFAKVAAAVRPAVVNVRALTRVSQTGPDVFADAGDAEEQRAGLGSGVIVDASGIVLTNAHVLVGATEIEVTTHDGRKHTATILGMDSRTDLALLRLDPAAAPFPDARLGDSNEARVGDWVLAVGSPYGLDATVTVGVLSGRGRQLGTSALDDFLQTDAAINFGNSGGPLVNLAGEVIGINTAVVEGATGLGFAIPSNLAKKIYADLRDRGRVARAWLGVMVQPITPELAHAFGATGGLLVSDVTPQSPAALAGLRPGDVLLAFEERKLGHPSDLARALADWPAGRRARLRLWRQRHETTLAATPIEERAATPAAETQRARTLLGFGVLSITPEMGVVVSAVMPAAPAAEAGVQRGDVIRELNGRAVRSLADFERTMRGMKEGDRVVLLLQRGPIAFWAAFTAMME